MRTVLSGLLALAVVPSLAMSVPSCPPETFVRPETITTPTTPYQVVSGDFNGDGHLDLLEAEENQVTVFLGAGDGNFGPPIVSPGVYNPTSLATGYFDGDNQLDVAIASGNGGVVVLLGNGDGSFQAPAPYLSSVYVNAVAVADITGDGKIDLIAGTGAPGIVLLPGIGDGTFGAPQVTSTASPPVGIAVADFNSDGHLDVAITQPTGIVSIYPGIGGGALGPPTDVKVGPNLGPIVAGDFNNDGNLDVAVGIDVYVGVLRGNGDGTFRAALEYRVGYSSGALQAADLNGDGLTDIVALRAFTYYNGYGVVTPMLQQADGSLAGGMSFLAGAGTTSFTMGDFNEDNLLDVATADQNASTLSVLIGEPSGRFLAPTYFGLIEQPIAVATGDFDGDGRQEVVILDYDGTVVLARVVDGVITTTPPANGGFYQSLGLTVADFNGDQKLDVAILSSSSVTVLLGNGDGTFQAPVNVPISSGQEFIVAGDFNGDGAPDLAFFSRDASYLPQVSTLLNDGAGNFSPGPATPLTHNIDALVAGRFDAGTTVDLVASNGDCCGSQYDTVLFLEGNGDGTFQAPVEFPSGPGPAAIAVADFNGDEAPDLLVANSNGSGGVSILLNTGTGFAAPALVAVGFPPYFVAAGDFNSDGQMDVFAANGAQGSLLLGAGGGTFDAPALYPAASIAGMVTAFVGGVAPSIVMISQESALELLFNANRSIQPLLTPIVLVSEPAHFVAAASGFGPLAYRWSRNGVPLTDGGSISGSQTSTLTIDPSSFADIASYSVSVTDSCGNTLSNPASLDVEFADVPVSSPFHNDILTIATAGITSGCGGSNYCPTSPVRRDQMAAFLLKAEHGSSYTPPPCSSVFADVPCPSAFANWIEQLSAEGVTSGCGGGNYCPASSVTRAQMAVFLLKTKNGSSYVPPPAVGIFGDVPVGSFAADYIEALYNQGISGGCQTSPLLYCPGNPVLRQQMATLLVRTFGLS